MTRLVARAGTLVSALVLSSLAVPAVAEGPVDAVLEALAKPSEGPVPHEAVDLALFRYARTADPADLGLAEALARRVSGPENRGVTSPGALFAVADAGGNTGGEAERAIEMARSLLTVSAQRATTDSFAKLVADFFRRAAYLESEDAYLEAIAGAGALFTTRVAQGDRVADVLPGGSAAQQAGLSDRLECLNVAVLNAGATGSEMSRDLVRNLAHSLLRAHWNDAASRLLLDPREMTGMPHAVEALLNARASLALWRAGHLTGEALFSGRAERILNAVRREGLADPASAPATALAAAVMAEGPLVVAVIGDPTITDMIRLRRDALSVFYPGKVVVPLDPARDRQRVHDLSCPGNADRAAFVIRDGGCSTPILSGVLLADALGSPKPSIRSRTRGPR